MTGSYVFYDFKWLTAKVEGSIHSLSLPQELIKIPAKQVTQNIGDEFNKDGKLYDVVRKEVIGDTLFLFVTHDNEEQQILSKIEAYFNTDNSQDLQNIHSTYQRFTLKDIGINEHLNGTFSSTDNSSTVKYSISNLLPVNPSVIFTPPPERILFKIS